MKLQIVFKSFFVIFVLVLSGTVKAEVPKRIVSLAPSITESIYQLGVERSLVGLTSYCDYPSQNGVKEVIGTLASPNIEKIYFLSPDLVLAVEGANRPQAIEKLRSLGLRVEVFSESRSFDDIVGNFMRLGILVGKKEKAKAIMGEIKGKVAAIAERVKKITPLKVFWEIGAKPLVSVSAKAFANEFINHSGNINIFSELPARYPRVSREEVLRRDPDIIVLVTMGDVTKKEKTYWQRFKNVKAVKFGRVYVVDSDKVCRPTPISFLRGLEEVMALFYPDNFEMKKISDL